MDRFFFIAGALSSLVGVALGAFGAHALRARLGVDMIRVWETGVHYQTMHALALLITSFAAARFPTGPVYAAGTCFLLGTLFFSGSLYLLSTMGWRWLGPVTPIGGLLFMIGWALLVIAALRA